MNIWQGIDLWVSIIGSTLVGMSIGGLIFSVWRERRRRKTPLPPAPTPRISGLDIFELPESLQNKKDSV